MRTDRREALQDSPPCRLALSESYLLSECIRHGDTDARNAVVEPEHPHPAAIENMMQRGVIRRVGRSLLECEFWHRVCTTHIREVREKSLRARKMLKPGSRQFKRPIQKS